MAIRHIAAAVLLVCTGLAHADPISSASATGGFLNNWTTGNGTDVLGSGVLGNGNVNLVGGVSHASTAKDASLTEVLLDKSSNNMTVVNGQGGQLFVERGIEGDYLLASGHGVLAATLGAGKSVIGSANGAVIVGGGAAPGMSGGGLDAGGGGAPSGDATGGGGSGGAPSGDGGSGGNVSEPFIPGGSGTPSGNGGNSGQVQTPAVDAADPAAVPEPSSVALMLAGMLGAGALSRRRKQ